jgi:hypothetical protein
VGPCRDPVEVSGPRPTLRTDAADRDWGTMTTYAYRTDTGEVLAVWETGNGACAARVTQVADTEHGMGLAAALSALSEVVWRIYTHPPTSEGDPTETNTPAWRRQHAREALERLPPRAWNAPAEVQLVAVGQEHRGDLAAAWHLGGESGAPADEPADVRQPWCSGVAEGGHRRGGPPGATVEAPVHPAARTEPS